MFHAATTSIKTQGYGALARDKTLKPISFERATPKTKELLIEDLYCGVCHSDVHIIDNAWGFSIYPCVPGHEATGRVLFAGPNVTSFSVGDLVGIGCMVNSCLSCSACLEGYENHCEAPTDPTMTYGGYLVLTELASTLWILDGMDTALAAPLLCPGVDTYGPLRRFNIKKGNKIGIVGIGGPGHLALMMAKVMGAEVTAFTTSERKISLIRKLGADHVVLSTDPEQMKIHEGSLQHILFTISNAFDPTQKKQNSCGFFPSNSIAYLPQN